MAKMGNFARSGQGLGSRSKKARVAAGGRANVDDRRNSPGFTSGKAVGPKTNIMMDEKPSRTKNSRKGVAGTALKLGKASPTQAVQSGRKLKNTSRGVSSSLPLGQGRGDPGATSGSKLKNTK